MNTRLLTFIGLLIQGYIQSQQSLQAQTISPYLIGNNAWYDGAHLDKIWGDMATAGFETIRIGGASAEGYGTNLEKYLKLIEGIRKAGAEPIVQVPRYLTSEQVTGLITAINVTHAKAIKLWSIGNEPDHKNRPSTLEEVSAYMKRIASALKAVDPTIKILGPETAGFQNERYIPALLGGDLDISGADANGNYYLDVYTWHRYMFSDIAGLEKDVDTMVRRLEMVNASRPEGKKISWGLTEFNTSYNNSKNQNPNQDVWSFHAGQVFAEIYGLGMRKGASMMTAWSMLEGEKEREGTDLSLFDKDLKGRSNYFHSLMLGQNMKKNAIAAVSDQSNIVVIPMADKTGVAVMLLNKDRVKGYEYTLRLDKTEIAPRSELNVNIEAGLARQITGTIPEHATQMLVFNADGKLTKTYLYTSRDADARQAPSVQTHLK